MNTISATPDEVPAIIVTDSKWQDDPKFKPDKGSTWNSPIKEDGWVHAHNSLRGEIKDIFHCLQSVSNKFPDDIPSWTTESIKTMWSLHKEHIISHHDNEDKILTPFMKKRIKLPEKLESDHSIIITLIDAVTTAANNVNELGSFHRITSAFDSYAAALLPHLLEEERISLPLLRAYFSPHEVKPQIMKIMKNNTGIDTGSFVHYMTEEKIRNGFMKQESIPFFVWHLVFKTKHNFFLKNMKIQFDALQSGTPPAVEKSKCGGYYYV